jgi:probable addiction module antidote protein
MTMALETAPYDTAESLDSEERIVAYLEAAFEDGDPALIAYALGAVVRARNISHLARETGLSRQALYKALSGEGNPGFDTIAKVMRALGLRMAPVPLDQPGPRRVGRRRSKTSGKVAA